MRRPYIERGDAADIGCSGSVYRMWFVRLFSQTTASAVMQRGIVKALVYSRLQVAPSPKKAAETHLSPQYARQSGPEHGSCAQWSAPHTFSDTIIEPPALDSRLRAEDLGISAICALCGYNARDDASNTNLYL